MCRLSVLFSNQIQLSSEQVIVIKTDFFRLFLLLRLNKNELNVNVQPSECQKNEPIMHGIESDNINWPHRRSIPFAGGVRDKWEQSREDCIDNSSDKLSLGFK